MRIAGIVFLVIFYRLNYKMKSKTKISKQIEKKTNPELVETIKSAKKTNGWLEIASILSSPRKRRINLNLDKINKLSEDKDIIVVPGKILSQGEIDKKIKLIAFSFSDTALEKIKKTGIEYSTIQEEIKKNPEAKGIKILKE